jgi:hypothetical protein
LGRRPKDATHAIALHAPPAPPSQYAEARAVALDWTEAEDNTLLALSKQYSYNWHLIADVFNGCTVRVPSDVREPWDVYDRWSKKFGPGSQAAVEAGETRDKIGKKTKYDGTKKDQRHISLYEAVRVLQRRREAMPPKVAGACVFFSCYTCSC